jgi:hypothetical protein
MTQSYPLAWPENWPRIKVDKRKSHSPFSTTFDKARRDLLDELRRLGARNVVISSWLPLRQDGQPRADVARRRIEDPGVAVYFELRGRPMVMARDAYWNIHDNIRSIGLAIEHLRGLERHGGAVMMERAFEGFAALPPPAKSDHWSTLGIRPTKDLDEIAAAFRLRAKDLHPDRGGDAAAMAELLDARSAAIREAK